MRHAMGGQQKASSSGALHFSGTTEGSGFNNAQMFQQNQQAAQMPNTSQYGVRF